VDHNVGTHCTHGAAAAGLRCKAVAAAVAFPPTAPVVPARKLAALRLGAGLGMPRNPINVHA